MADIKGMKPFRVNRQVGNLDLWQGDGGLSQSILDSMLFNNSAKLKLSNRQYQQIANEASCLAPMALECWKTISYSAERASYQYSGKELIANLDIDTRQSSGDISISNRDIIIRLVFNSQNGQELVSISKFVKIEEYEKDKDAVRNTCLAAIQTAAKIVGA